MMIRLLGLFVLTVFSQSVGAIEFFHGSWEEALLKAKEEKKIVFVDAYTSWCGPCKLMSSRIFPDPEVSAFYDEKFINVKLDMEKGEGPKFASKYGIRAYPTLLYIDDAGKLLQRKVGVMQAPELISTGKAVLKKYNRKEDYDKLYLDEKNHNPEFILAYLKELRKAEAPTAKVANLFLRDHSELTATHEALISFEGVETTDSDLFETISKNSAILINEYGVEKYKQRIRQACEATVDLARKFDSPELLHSIALTKEAYGVDLTKPYQIKYDLLDKNWTGAQNQSLQIAKNEFETQVIALEELTPYLSGQTELDEGVEYLSKQIVKNTKTAEPMAIALNAAHQQNNEELMQDLIKAAEKSASKQNEEVAEQMHAIIDKFKTPQK